jgi:hypothetical protein
MLRLIADENMPVRVIVELRRLGHDVAEKNNAAFLSQSVTEREFAKSFVKRHNDPPLDLRSGQHILIGRGWHHFPRRQHTATEVLLRIRSFPQ